MSAITITLPRLLAALAGDTSRVEIDAASIAEALERLGEVHPQLRVHLFDDGGRFRQHVSLFHNGGIVRWPACADTPLTDGDEVGIVQAVSGG